MRLNIRHETAYRYATPASRAIEVLRLVPRGHNGQYIAAWRIDVDRDCRLDQSTDAFGNLMHEFTLDGPIEELTIVAEGSVETIDTAGVLNGQVERFPPVLYLRDTALTVSDALIRDFAREIAGRAGNNRLTLMHAIMEAMRERMRFDVDATNTGTTAIEAFALGQGVCQDFAHVFIAACRHLGIPARYTSGYLLAAGGGGDQSAGHAWAEALIEELGWVGFDPANGVCPTDSYVRLAVGLDYLGAAPVRGLIFGGGEESLSVRIAIHPDARSTGG
jgi:transglutaminase-like putative cysteine protease